LPLIKKQRENYFFNMASRPLKPGVFISPITAACIRRMANDYKKYQTVLANDCDARALWNIGYFKSEYDEEEVGRQAKEALDKHLPADSDYFQVKKVGEANMFCVIF
jgi:hypothetical protein